MPSLTNSLLRKNGFVNADPVYCFLMLLPFFMCVCVEANISLKFYFCLRIEKVYKLPIRTEWRTVSVIHASHHYADELTRTMRVTHVGLVLQFSNSDVNLMSFDISDVSSMSSLNKCYVTCYFI